MLTMYPQLTTNLCVLYVATLFVLNQVIILQEKRADTGQKLIFLVRMCRALVFVHAVRWNAL